MSGGPVCCCKDKKVARRKAWRIVQYRCNHSAFNGWRETASDYSSITCLTCGRVWRTRASYVESLPKLKPGEWQ